MHRCSVAMIPLLVGGFPFAFDDALSPGALLARPPLDDEDPDNVGSCIPIVTSRVRSGVTARSVIRKSDRAHESFFLPSVS